MIDVKIYGEKLNAAADKILAMKSKLSKLKGREYDAAKEEFEKVELALSALNDEMARF